MTTIYCQTHMHTLCQSDQSPDTNEEPTATVVILIRLLQSEVTDGNWQTPWIEWCLMKHTIECIETAMFTQVSMSLS